MMVTVLAALPPRALTWAAKTSQNSTSVGGHVIWLRKPGLSPYRVTRMSSHLLITLTECVLFIPAVSLIVCKLADNPWNCSPMTAAFRAAVQPSGRNSLKDLHVLLEKSCSFELLGRSWTEQIAKKLPRGRCAAQRSWVPPTPSWSGNCW